MKARTFTFLGFLLIGVGLFAQPGTILNFEDEYVTDSLIATMHTDDWQTDPAYTRDLFCDNPDTTGINKTYKCASFSGYSSDDDWWYGLDFVSADSFPVNDTQYLHFAMMTTDLTYDVNRGVLIIDTAWTELANIWFPVTDQWADYVFKIPDGAKNIKELRFMLNHKGNITTYLDEIAVTNDSVPRTILEMDTTTTSVYDLKITKPFKIYTREKQIRVVSTTTNFDIEVYNICGSLIFRKNVSGNEITIPVKKSGLYIVRSKGISQKVIVF